MNKPARTYVKMSKWVTTLTLFLVLIMIGMASYISLSTEVFGYNLSEIAANRNVKSKELVANRGTIFDRSSNVIAQNVASYTVIAYLDPIRSEGSDTPLHVVDKVNTAKALAPVLNMEEEDILVLLDHDCYQVELGPGGRGITELKKEEIEELNLPGIGFLASYKRYYPNGIFSSYNIGYAKTNEEGMIVGELGLELQYEDILSGENGYLEFESDRLGYQIPDTNEIREDAIDGSDIYLTIDSNIQYFVENALSSTYEEYNPEWILLTVMDANTGEILASSNYPTFDPNKLNISQYLNPLVSYTYEPGSTMKTFTYLAAMESGVYDGDETFYSKSFKVGPDTINNWSDRDFGTITYDKGYVLSSNVGIASLIDKYMTRDSLMNFYKDLGFGEKVGLNLPSEYSGVINFKYPVEVITAGFGQGITVTPIQMLQALTVITNEGELLKPYLVSKIVDQDGNITYEAKREVVRAVASKESADKILELMEAVIYDEDSIATQYMVDKYGLIGKTGTAQIVSSSGKYLTGANNFIYSFSGIFPKDDPEIIIYGVMKRPTWGGNAGLATALTEVVDNVGNYLDLSAEEAEEANIINYEMPSFINKSIAYAEDTAYNLNTNYFLFGDGAIVIDQYPKIGFEMTSAENIFLLTNGENYLMPDITGWSLREVISFANFVGLDLNISGYGFVTSQSIEVEASFVVGDSLIVELEPITFEEEF